MPTNSSKKPFYSAEQYVERLHKKSSYSWKWDPDDPIGSEIAIYYDGEKIGEAIEFFAALEVERKHRNLMKLIKNEYK